MQPVLLEFDLSLMYSMGENILCLVFTEAEITDLRCWKLLKAC